MIDEHEDEFRTIRTNRAVTEVAQQGSVTHMIRIVYLDLGTYRMLQHGHVLGVDNDEFVSLGHYRDPRGSRISRIRPTREQVEADRRDMPETESTREERIRDFL